MYELISVPIRDLARRAERTVRYCLSERPHRLRQVARLKKGPVLEAMPSVKAIVADRGYPGLAGLCRRRGVALDIKAPPKGTSRFTPLKPLWRIEDAFARLGR